jgi:hypothetical protein
MAQCVTSESAVSQAILARRVATSLRRPLRPAENEPCGSTRSSNAPTDARLPAIEPGQLWFVELPVSEAHPISLGHRALTTANVVIFDHVLRATVAKILPLGSYAEPAASSDSEWALERSLRLAREGWSVIRLVEAGLSSSQRIRWIRRLSERLIAANVPAGLPVSLFASGSDGTCREAEADLGGVLDACDIEKHQTIIFGALGTGAPCLQAALSNGLAG